MMSDDIQYGIRLTGDASGVKAAFIEGGQAAKKFSEDVVATGSAAQSLIDKYDPLGARLRSLKQDFQALSEAARTGQIAQGDDARVDATYQRIRKQIKDTEEAINSFGAAGQKGFKAAADAADKSAFATAGARRELIVLAHEAVSGNFSRMPGSFMVLAERMAAGGEALLAFGGAAAAVVGVSYLVAKGLADAADEAREFNNTISATGGYSGKTRDDLVNLAHDVAESSGLAVSQAKQIVLEMDRSGRIGAQAFDAIALSVGRFAAATGTTAETATKTLVRAFEDPARGAEQLNAQFHFLNNAEAEYIKSAQDSNRVGEAQALMAQRLTEKLKDQEIHVGILKGLWNGLSNAWDRAFTGPSTNQSLNWLNQQVSKDLAEYQRTGAMKWLDEAQRLQAQAEQLRAKIQTDQQASAAQAAADEQNQKNSYARSLIGRYSRNYRVKELDDQEQAIRALKPSSDDEAEYQRTALEEIERRKKLEQTSREDRAAANKAAEEQYRAAIAVQEGLQKRESDALKAHLADLASQRKRGLISAQEETQQSYASQRADIDKQIAIITQERDVSRKVGKQGDATRYDQQIKELQQKRIDLIRQESNALGELATARDKATAALQRSFEKDAQSVRNQEALIGLDKDAAKKASYAQTVGERLRQATIDDNGKVRDNVDVSGMATAAAKAIADYNKALDELKAKQDAYNADWRNGVTEALKDYADKAKNTAALTREAMTSAMNATSDAIVRFATTGKVSFSDFTRSILGDLAKIAAEKATAGIFGSLFGSVAAANGAVFGGLRPMANGDVLNRPTTFWANGNTRVLAGEAGDEGVLPLKRTRDGKLGVIAQGGGGGVEMNITNYITVQSGTDATDTGNKIGDALKRQFESLVLKVIVQQKAPGGQLAGVKG